MVMESLLFVIQVNDPPRRYAATDLCIYNAALPQNTGRQKHPFSGRFGETADMMKKQLCAKVPLPTETPQPTISCDGTVGIELPLLFDNESDREVEEEDRQRDEDVLEVVLDMLDTVEEMIVAADEFDF